MKYFKLEHSDRNCIADHKLHPPFESSYSTSCPKAAITSALCLRPVTFDCLDFQRWYCGVDGRVFFIH